MGDSGDWKMIADVMEEVDLGTFRVNSDNSERSGMEIELTPIAPKTKKKKTNFRTRRFRVSLDTIPEQNENSV
ncbi:MAG: hypothetical protein CMB64_03510 [Euryarchaeota archaeon]|nr:hypothetical protein [Euryarchaeota archaeon]|tara:strand:+ start:602 stop:820 length:219 start_codon:yes stop_codon:yes gene_type:complete